MGFQFFIQTERENDFTAHGIPIGFRPTGHIPVKQTPASSCPHRITFGKPFLLKSGCIVCLATILGRGKRTLDSSSPHWITPGKPVIGEIRVNHLPSNRPHSSPMDPGFEFPTSNYPWHHRNLSQLASLPRMFFWPGDRQTNRQTYFIS